MNKKAVERIHNVRPNDSDTEVTLKEMGDTYEIRYSSRNTGGNVRLVGNGLYVYSDGEGGYLKDAHGEVIVKEMNRSATTRADNLTTVARSMRELREIIKCNVTDKTRDKCLWVTVTYRENMKNPKKLYRDTEKYMKRLRYYLAQYGFYQIEYIISVEAQGRGSLHGHLIIIIKDCDTAPFIPNDIMAKIWGHGFTKTKSLKGIKDPSLYLTAYLSDLDYTKAARLGIAQGDIKEVSVTDDDGNIILEDDGQPLSKAIVKGARLKLLPKHLKIFRTSRGIVRPLVIRTTEGEAMATVGDAELTYERTIRISEDDFVCNVINYRTFKKNDKPKPRPPPKR